MNNDITIYSPDSITAVSTLQDRRRTVGEEITFRVSKKTTKSKPI